MALISSATTASTSATRERLMNAALQLFSEKGFQGATTREIAMEAGVAEVTLFRYFPSKDQLLAEVIREFGFVQKLHDLIPTITNRSYEEGLKIIASEMLDTLAERKDWIRIMHAEVQRSSENMVKIYHAFLDDLFGTYAQYFSTMQAKGLMSSVDPEFAARAFHGIFFCFFNIEEILHRNDYKATDRDRAIDEFIRLFVHGTSNRPKAES